MEIKVLESSCCGTPTKMLDHVKEAVSKLGIQAEIKHLTDLQETMQYGITKFPVLVVNEKVLLYGKDAGSDEISQLLKKELKTVS